MKRVWSTIVILLQIGFWDIRRLVVAQKIIPTQKDTNLKPCGNLILSMPTVTPSEQAHYPPTMSGECSLLRCEKVSRKRVVWATKKRKGAKKFPVFFFGGGGSLMKHHIYFTVNNLKWTDGFKEDINLIGGVCEFLSYVDLIHFYRWRNLHLVSGFRIMSSR